MTEVRLRERSVSEIVDAAFALYRQDSGKYIMVMAIATIPQLVSRLLLRTDGSLAVGTLMVGLITVLISSITFTIGSAAIAKLGAAVYLGERADLETTVQSVVPKVWAILLAGFLKSVLYAIGFMAFFVGAIYVAARFFAVTSVIVLEDAGVGEAFSRSSQLSLGRKRHIVNTLLLVGIIYGLLSICAGVVAGLTGSAVLAIALTTVFQIVAYPVVGLTAMLLYYDCRIRGEGFDIERMAASMDRRPGPDPSPAGGAAGAAGATTQRP
jgi:hypothetical protein